MTDIVNPILQWLNANPELAGLATFIISAGESVAVLGTIVPGTVMMTAIGTLAGAGVIPLIPTLIWAALGAVVGDGISYWLGWHFKDRMHQVWPFRKHPEWLVRGEAFFHKYGGMSVFIGRFVGPVRALVPLVAGMLGMRPLKFYIANILSAILWAPIYMFPGILLGAISLELPPDIAVHVILMLFLGALLFILCSWLVLKFFVLINVQINNSLNNLWNKLKKSRAGSVIIFALKHHNLQKTHGQLVLAFYFIVITAVFCWLMHHVIQVGSPNIFVNNAVYYFFRSLHTPTLNTLMVCLTFLGEKAVALSLFGLLFLWLLVTRKLYAAFHLLALMILTVMGVEAAKYYALSPRPIGLAIPVRGFSFPSGHTTFATTLYIGVALLISSSFREPKRFFVYTGVILAFLVGVSRMYLEAHWLTDVIGGWLLGSALLILTAISFNRKKAILPTPASLCGFFVSAFIIVYGAFFLHAFKKFPSYYQLLDYPTITTTTDNWWQQKGKQLPRYRFNRFGLVNQVLNLQWVGNLNDIEQSLLQNNWEEPPERDWINIIMRLSDVQSMQYLPLLSPMYFDKKPALVLIKRIDKSRNLLVLRLWESRITFKNTTQALWVGTVEPAPRTYNWLLRKKHHFVLAPRYIFQNKKTGYSFKEIVLPFDKKSQTSQVILLIKSQ